MLSTSGVPTLMTKHHDAKYLKFLCYVLIILAVCRQLCYMALSLLAESISPANDKASIPR